MTKSEKAEKRKNEIKPLVNFSKNKTLIYFFLIRIFHMSLFKIIKKMYMCVCV